MAFIPGSEDADTLDGTIDNDRIVGRGGNDLIRPEGGFDLLYGGAGDDWIDGHAGTSRAYGQAGNDVINSGAGNDILDGGGGNDSISAFGGRDTVFGGNGNDTIVDGSGLSSLDGGAGVDQIAISASGLFVFDSDGNFRTPSNSVARNFESVNVFGSSGQDDFTGGAHNDLLRGWMGNDTLDGAGGADFLIGDNGEDVLRGGGGHDFLTGGGHDDTLIGGSGNDTLRGGAHFDVFSGTDWMEGGLGADTFLYAGQPFNLTFENSRTGVYVDMILGRGFGGDAQGDRYTAGARILVGSAHDDLLVGGGDQRGGEGNDRLVQAAGTSAMTGDDGFDEFVFIFNRNILFNRVTVMDFDQAGGEKIDLSEIDGAPRIGRQPLDYIGNAAFSGAAGELRWEVSNGETVIQMTLDTSGQVHTLALAGEFTLAESDFLFF